MVPAEVNFMYMDGILFDKQMEFQKFENTVVLRRVVETIYFSRNLQVAGKINYFYNS